MASAKKYFLPLLLFIVTFFVYAHNLSQSTYGGDVGDLVTAAFVFGVPHPPGYPLFTLLGFLLTRIHFLTPAFMVGLISVISSSLAVIFYYVLALKLTRNKFIALVSVLILAFNYFFWFYSEIAEVFALNNLFVMLLILLAYFYYKDKKIKYFYLLSFFSGLSLTNHQTIILIFPSLFILAISSFGKEKHKIKKLLAALLFFALGLLPYLYVPIAASNNPVVNWDRVKDLSSFLHLVLRQDYGTFSSGLFTKPNLQQCFVILGNYFFRSITQLTLPVVALILLGAFSLIKKNKLLLVSLFLAFFLSGPLFIFYAGFPITGSFMQGVYERFLLMSLVIGLIFFPLGLSYLIFFINRFFGKKLFQNLFIGVFLIIPLTFFFYNFPKTNLSNIWIGDYLAYDLLSPLPKNSVFFVSGDTPAFNTWYVHYALGFRPDIEVINNNNNYFNNQRALYLKEHPQEKNSKNLIINVVKEIAKTRSVFSINKQEGTSGNELIWFPYGLVYKLELSQNDVPTKDGFLNYTARIWQNFKFLKDSDKNNLALETLTILDIPTSYSNAMLETGNFLFTNYHDFELPYTFYQKALEIDKNNYKVYETLAVYYLFKKNCSLVAENAEKAIDIYPLDQLPYYLQYLDYKDCFKDQSKAKQVLSEYKQVFKSDMLKNEKNLKESVLK